MTTDRLMDHLVGGARDSALADEIRAWLVASARFRTFADAHRDKIRKKLRSASGIEALRDVRTELRVAQMLVRDKRIEVSFEAYGSTRGGPDFTVTLRGEGTFNLEVTRLQRPPAEATHGGPLLTKVRQLPPSVPNAVLIAVEGDSARAFDVGAAARSLRARADASDDTFFASRGFSGRRGFYERYLRLGAVFVWCEGATGEERATVWANPSARIRVPERALRTSLSALQAP